MFWIALRFLLLGCWLLPLHQGCRRREQGDRPWLFVMALLALTGLWLELAPQGSWWLLLSWLLLPWLSLGLVRLCR
ncbi:hypothetical protein PVT67_03600 [Gallaecimonas kandeliae]|uniref:hypothetical protein n=1 Tax=Gallaecimonas kandeliae TaxID=3029055 RepID=UPI0026487152|nr:hypothetical protein [Gallaecimonas kandeliae]WKE66347.1 hypothetical protein PVT67_03600 [Gallaecimonas kandeliae]